MRIPRVLEPGEAHSGLKQSKRKCSDGLHGPPRTLSQPSPSEMILTV
jgi:hypothetical protein